MKNNLQANVILYLKKYKNHIDQFSQITRNIYFILILNLFFNIFMFFKTLNDSDYNSFDAKRFFPFYRGSSFSIFDYYISYSRDELIFYGYLPLVIFYVWYFFFNGKNKF